MKEEEDMKREHLYVSRKHPCVWLMGLATAASAVLRILQGDGIVWLDVVAAVLYALITVISCEEMLYRTAVPVWLMGLCIAIPSGRLLSHHLRKNEKSLAASPVPCSSGRLHLYGQPFGLSIRDCYGSAVDCY